MRNIKISCVIPTCDRNNLLIETLNSVLSQTSLPDEIIIVNNGDQKLDLPLNKNVNIKIYNIIKYVGVAQALNFGVNISKGNYIAFLEDDDLWEQNYIKNIRESIETNYSVYVSRIDKLQKNKIIKYKNAINKINVNIFLTHNPEVIYQNLCVKKEPLII
jgi:Predicted glycosyltransferases